MANSTAVRTELNCFGKCDAFIMVACAQNTKSIHIPSLSFGKDTNYRFEAKNTRKSSG